MLKNNLARQQLLVSLVNISSSAYIFFSLLGTLASIYSLYITIPKISLSTKITIIIVCFGGLIFGILHVISIISQKKFFFDDEILTDGFHSVCHDIRDHLYDLENLITRTQDKDIIYKSMVSKVREIAEMVSVTLSSFADEKICSCIKIFELGKIETDKSKMILKTICRSTNTNIRRKSYSTSKVIENTDFEYIIDGNDDFFAVPDLEKFASNQSKDSPYKNSNLKWAKYYKTTIVVPIRKLRESINEGDSYDILGFLCIDSLNTNVFTEEKYNTFLKYLASVADLLYILLEKSNRCFLAETKGV